MTGRNWQVREAPFQPQRLAELETNFTVGNGYLGTRGTFEEGYPGEQPLVLVHGLFNTPLGGSVPELAGVPGWLPMRISIDGVPFRLDRGEMLGYERVLDLRCGVLRRAVLWRAVDGPICRLSFERFASLAREHVLALRVQVQALDRGADVEILSQFGEADAAHWREVAVGNEGATHTTLQAQTTQADYRVGMAACLQAWSDEGAQPIAQAAGQPGSLVRCRLEPGQTLTAAKLVTLYTSRDTDQPLEAARQELQKALDAGYQQLYRENAAAWEAVWQYADVQIDGDDFAQLAMRFSLYHLNIAGPRHDDRVSIGAKTLSGRGYKGHVFWDTELFALTPFTYTQPHIARNLLMYRYHLLPGARKKAAQEGLEGAMFPWESTDTGEETTPQWSDPHPESGERERIWTGEREIHISADIAYALHTYWQVTGDDDFMARYGAELILDTAIFWGSRAEHNAAQDRYEFSCVIGPDEYHEGVDNSVFTNAMARWHLQTALDVLAWLQHHDAGRHAALVSQLDLTPERLARWQDIVAKMYIPTQGDIYVQFDGFFDLELVDVKAYEPRTHSLQLVFGTERVNQTQIIKQADVVMLIALLGEQLGPPARLRANWDVYEPRCDHGSSLSAAMHSLVAARLGLLDAAYDYWRQAAGVDLENNKGNTGHGIHAATAGGLWQATVLGLAGLQLADGAVRLTPHLPPHWRRLRFKVLHRGQVHDITITPDGIQVT